MSTRSPTFSLSNDFTSEGTWTVIFSPETFLIVSLRSALSTAVTTTVACVVWVRDGIEPGPVSVVVLPSIAGGGAASANGATSVSASAPQPIQILCALLFIVLSCSGSARVQHRTRRNSVEKHGSA